MATPVYPADPSSFAWATAAERHAMASGSVASSALRPLAADLANPPRASSTLPAASTVLAPTAAMPGIADTTSPAPSVTMPARPSVSTHESRTVATVAYEATTFAPASAVESATACTSADLF